VPLDHIFVEPITTDALCPYFLGIAQPNVTTSERLHMLDRILRKLPPENHAILCHVLKLLKRVAELDAQPPSAYKALGVILGSVIFGNASATTSLTQMRQVLERQALVTALLIENCHIMERSEWDQQDDDEDEDLSYFITPFVPEEPLSPTAASPDSTPVSSPTIMRAPKSSSSASTNSTSPPKATEAKSVQQLPEQQAPTTENESSSSSPPTVEQPTPPPQQPQQPHAPPASQDSVLLPGVRTVASDEDDDDDDDDYDEDGDDDDDNDDDEEDGSGDADADGSSGTSSTRSKSAADLLRMLNRPGVAGATESAPATLRSLVSPQAASSLSVQAAQSSSANAARANAEPTEPPLPTLQQILDSNQLRALFMRFLRTQSLDEVCAHLSVH
jgi:hypothetical protein